MFDVLKDLFRQDKTDYAQLIQGGATILDVRTKREYEGGHIAGSVNIPVDQLGNNLNKLKDKARPVITCCASGMRSATARSILTSHGYTAVFDGGGYLSLQNKIR